MNKKIVDVAKGEQLGEKRWWAKERSEFKMMGAVNKIKETDIVVSTS